VAPLKRDAAADLVRGMIADGMLNPGAPVPSGAALARKTGFCALTCRQALGTLLADGTLTRGVSPTARLRVAQRGRAGADDGDALRVTLSRSLAGRRRAAGMTQPELAMGRRSSTSTYMIRSSTHPGSGCLSRARAVHTYDPCRTAAPAGGSGFGCSGRNPAGLPVVPK
jgi:hypothetical protein